MAKSSKNSGRNPSKNLIIVLLVIILLVLSFLLFAKNSEFTKTNDLTDSCEYGFIPKASFLRTYTVKSGDTLLSIAQNELGSTARVNELINLNKDRYPNLSLSNNFLEIGYQLYLPPQEILNSSGKLFVINAKIIDNATSDWSVKVKDSLTYGIYPEENTIFEGKSENEFKPGDCVMIVGDSGASNKALMISPQ